MSALLCSKCGFNNPPGMRFCGGCGTRLGTTGILEPQSAAGQPDLAALPEQVGVMMGANLLERFRQAGLEAAGQRRNVTLLFADLTGFTGLSQRLDTEELFVLVQQLASMLARSVYKYDGMVDKFIGDGLMAIFGAPIAQENNAEMAIRAALDMQQELVAFSREVQERYHNEEMCLHLGLHTGTVIVGSMGSSLMMNYTAIGDVVNLAARLQQNADPGTILVSQAVYQFTRPLFDFEMLSPLALKGYSAPVPAFRLIGPRVMPGSVRGIEGLSAPLIGREAELKHLQAAGDRLMESQQGQFILIEGDAGIGKSRLISETRAYLKSLSVRVVSGQSYTYRRTVAYWLFQDLLRNLFGLQQNTNEPLAMATIKDRLHRIMGAHAADTLPYIYYMLSLGVDRPEVSEHVRYLDAAQLRQRIFLAVRQVLAAEANVTPMLVIFEDVHWADEASINLLTSLVDGVLESPYICLSISRQYKEEGLARMAEKARRYLGDRFIHHILPNLNPEQSRRLLAELLTNSELPFSLKEQVVARSAGNPFYMEEILRMLIEDKKIYYQEGCWRLTPNAPIDTLGVPDTLQGLILARFDRIEPAYRRTLQVATVIGRNFSSSVLAEVLRPEGFDLARLPAILAELDQRGFILPQAGLSDFDYLFKHVLVSDAIYSTLLKAERNELHGLVGEAIETLYPGGDLVELLARHYAWSSRYGRALHYLILAGQKDARNYANQQARRSFEQAIEILARIEHTPDQEITAHTGLGDVLVLTGEYPIALQNYQAALNGLDKLDYKETILRRSVLLRKLSTVHERQGAYEEALAVLAEAQVSLGEEASPVEQAWILNATGWIHMRRGRLEIAEKSLRTGLELAGDSQEYDVIASLYNRLGGVAYQKGLLEEASACLQRSLELRQRIGDVNAVARSYNNLGLLNWRNGNWDSALENYKRSYDLLVSLGDVEATIDTNINMGLVHLNRSDFDNAYQCFSQALASAQKIGHTFNIGFGYLHLARYAIFREDWPQAFEYCRHSREIFTEIGNTENMVNAEIYWGLACLNTGDLVQARAAGENALRLLEKGNKGASDERAYTQRFLGLVLRAEGHDLAAAVESVQKSIDMYAKVGNKIERARSQRVLADLQSARGDEAAAVALLSEARQTFERLGARFDLKRL